MYKSKLQFSLVGLWFSFISVALSPDGRQLASGSDDSIIKLWNVASGALQQTFEGHSDLINSVAFSPDGRHLASGSDDRTIKLWKAAAPQPLQQIFEGHLGRPRSINFSPDGRQLA